MSLPSRVLANNFKWLPSIKATKTFEQNDLHNQLLLARKNANFIIYGSYTPA